MVIKISSELSKLKVFQVPRKDSLIELLLYLNHILPDRVTQCRAGARFHAGFDKKTFWFNKALASSSNPGVYECCNIWWGRHDL